MMKPAVGAVVRCGDRVPGVYATLSSVIGASSVGSIVLVADPSTPSGATAWLSAFCRSRNVQYCQAESTLPGHCWNVGLRALGEVDWAICVEAGDVVRRAALDSAIARAAVAADCVGVTSGIEWVGPTGHRQVTTPPGGTAVDVLADPHAVHVSSVFRWSQWCSLGGFDEQIPALEHAELWLRLLAGGGEFLVSQEPFLHRVRHVAALYRRAWTTGEIKGAAEHLYRKHRQLAADCYARVLEAKERRSVLEHHRYQRRLSAARQIEHDIRSLDAERDAIDAEIPAALESGADLVLLARPTPLSNDWGYDRGTPADRPIIEGFLAAHAHDIRGRVLEVQEDDYSRRFGAARVTHCDVIDLDVSNPRATVVGDLRSLDHVATATYDCIILTQTLHVVDDARAVVRECHRILKPGGVLLATLPSASRVCLEYGPEGDFWRVTEAGARTLVAEVFDQASVDTYPMGNPLIQAAFAYGLASEELTPAAYATANPFSPALIGVRAEKNVQRPQPVEKAQIPVRSRAGRGLILMYHRIAASRCDPNRLSVTEPTFRTQLRWLRDTCSVVPLADFIGASGSLPERAVALTFDDGYLDNLSVALGLLAGEDIPATFFVTTADGPEPFHYWWDRLAWCLLGQAPPAPSVTLRLPHRELHLNTSSPERCREAHRLAHEALVPLPQEEREAALASVCGVAAAPLTAADRRLAVHELPSLVIDDRFAIGVHTVNHLFLPAQSEAVQRRELAECRHALERVIGTDVTAVAYPFGGYDERSMAAAGDEGFRLAVTCESRAVHRGDLALALPRLEVADEPLAQFSAKLDRAFRTVA